MPALRPARRSMNITRSLLIKLCRSRNRTQGGTVTAVAGQQNPDKKIAARRPLFLPIPSEGLRAIGRVILVGDDDDASNYGNRRDDRNEKATAGQPGGGGDAPADAEPTRTDFDTDKLAAGFAGAATAGATAIVAAAAAMRYFPRRMSNSLFNSSLALPRIWFRGNPSTRTTRNSSAPIAAVQHGPPLSVLAA